MDKVQETAFTDYYTPSSKPFRLNSYSLRFTCFMGKLIKAYAHLVQYVFVP
jgi:hypothetical protein